MIDSYSFSNLFAPDTGSQQARALAPGKPWKVLLVDDEDDMHTVLHMTLKDMEVEGFPLQLLDARSVDEAKVLLSDHHDVSLILLDVVMETELAGLSLVTHVRDEICNHIVQIVLVTGQPGYAPEQQIRAAYDINGYRLKSELSAYNIYTSVSLAVQAYMRERQSRDEPDAPEIATKICLENAIDAHRKWRQVLAAAVAAGDTLDSATLRRNDCCELGNWLHSHGRRLYGGKPEFVRLMARHNDFHLVASMVANSVNDGEYTDAKKMFSGNSQFAQASIDVEIAIMRLKFSLLN